MKASRCIAGLASLFLVACGSAASPTDSGTLDATARDVTAIDRAAADATAAVIDAADHDDVAVTHDAGGDSGPVNTGVPCDAATYVTHCDAAGLIISCVSGTVYEDHCPSGGSCRTHPLGIGACIQPGLGFCSASDFHARCDGDRLVTCTLFPPGTPGTGAVSDASDGGGGIGVEDLESCGAGEVCQTGGSGVACGPTGASPCDPVTFVDRCGDDHRHHECIDGLERVSSGCSDGYTCAAVPGGMYHCVDAALTACDPATTAGACEHGPEAATRCDSTGFVVHQACVGSNPVCSVLGSFSGCSYASAPPSPSPGQSMGCDATDGQFLRVCPLDAIPYRIHCLVGTGRLATCACRTMPFGDGCFLGDETTPCGSD